MIISEELGTVDLNERRVMSIELKELIIKWIREDKLDMTMTSIMSVLKWAHKGVENGDYDEYEEWSDDLDEDEEDEDEDGDEELTEDNGEEQTSVDKRDE